MDPRRLKIPETSPTRYLSGIVALNIPSEAGTGDWHQTQDFFIPHTVEPTWFVIERGQEIDPSAFLGEEGIYDASAALDQIGVEHPKGPVYAANHARAVADLVLASALRGKTADHVDLDEWMPRDADKREVLKMLDKAAERLGESHIELISKWVGRNLHIRGIDRGRER